MKSALKNNLNNSIEHSILKAQGFKFSCDDINILNNLINSVATNENVNYFNLLKLLMLEKHNDNENEVLMIDDEVFNEIAKENVILRANVGERFDINFFKNTPIYISNGQMEVVYILLKMNIIIFCNTSKNLKNFQLKQGMFGKW